MAWRVIPEDRLIDFAGVALDLRDEFTGTGIIGAASFRLEVLAGTIWRTSARQPVRNAGGVYVWTGLGRALDPISLPQFRVRVRIEAERYRPGFQAFEEVIEFDVPTYNSAVPPTFSSLIPEVVLMWPGPNYPFAAHVRALRGRVIDAGGEPVSDAQLTADAVERVMTGPSGAFTLPLRWQAPDAAVNVAVNHPRSGLSANAIFQLPGALVGNHDITVT